MDNIMLAFHHIGVACRDIEKTKVFYTETLGYSAAPTVNDPLQRVKVCFLAKDGEPRIELLEPVDETSPVNRTLKTVGVSPYHLCYEVDDISLAVAELREQRFLLVSGPVPACAMDGNKVAFMYSKKNGLIELVEKSR